MIENALLKLFESGLARAICNLNTQFGVILKLSFFECESSFSCLNLTISKGIENVLKMGKLAECIQTKVIFLLKHT